MFAALDLVLVSALAGPPLVPDDYWRDRPAPELRQELDRACTRAVSDREALLLTFSASWCPDSRAVAHLEQSAPIAEELERHWTRVVIDVGRFDQHERLQEAFDVRSIPTYVAVKPDCARGPWAWEVLDQRAFEPTSDPTVDASAVVTWLQGARPTPAAVPRPPESTTPTAKH